MTLVSWQSSAQTQSAKGRFEVDVIKGCTGMIVNVTTTTGLAGVQYWYDKNPYDSDGPLGSKELTFTYNENGSFWLQQGVESNSEGLDSLLIEVVVAEKPTFKVHNCTQYQASVEITDDYYDFYQVRFQASSSENVDPFSFSTPFNYFNAGTENIVVTGMFENSYNNCGVDNQSFELLNAIQQPVLSSINTLKVSPANGAMEIGHVPSLPSNTIYNLEQSIDGVENFTPIQEIDGPLSFVDQLNTESEYQCFRIFTLDACTSYPVIDTIFSDIICSVYFHVEGTEEANTITWQTDTVLANSYTVIRNGDILSTITDTSITTYDDKDVICNKEYAYNLQPNFNTGFSISQDTAVIAKKSQKLPAVDYPSSTFEDDQVVLNWGPPDTGEIPFRRYIIEKNIRDRAWKVYDTSEDTTYTDTKVNLAVGKHAYRITYDDDCGNLAVPSPGTNPMIFSQADVRGNSVTFEWSKYETWLDGIKGYFIERVDEDGNVLEEFPVLSGRSKEITFSINDSEDKIMRVRADGLAPTPEVSYSNTVTTRLAIKMYLPTAFTPDNDGLNDIFTAKGPVVYNFKMEIYNRWGGLIFVTEDNFNGWDGTIKGEDAPEGTYIYKIYFEDAETRNYDQTGSMILLRKI